MKKFLTALLIGAFIFAVGTANFASARSIVSDSYKYADGRDSHADKKETKDLKSTGKDGEQMKTHDGKNPPEPPKDSDGKPLPPPDKNNGEQMNNHDGKNPPEPPRDSNGKPLPPPDKNDIKKYS